MKEKKISTTSEILGGAEEKFSQATYRTDKLTLSRRDFLKISGTGLFVFFFVGDPLELVALPQGQTRSKEFPTDFNAYLLISEDGRIHCFSGKVELGQGIKTSLAQILAEELDVNLEVIEVVLGDTALCPYDMGTFGSRTIKYFGSALRLAAAEARAVLVELASEKLGVPKEQLATKNGFVYDLKRPSKKIAYGQLTKGKRIERYLSSKPQPKPIEAHQIAGKPWPRLDGLEKVTGKAIYAGDVILPNMVFARLLRPPAHGAKLKSLSLDELKDMPEIEVIQDGDLIAVLHPTFDGASRALGKIKAEYDLPKNELNDKNIHEHLIKVAPAGNIVDQKGSLEEGEKLAQEIIEATYFNPYVAHSPIETHTALVSIEKDEVKVWASTQRPFGVQSEVAQILGIPANRIRVFPVYVGGGFGGKNRNRQVIEAARLAQKAGKPVMVIWTREEEFFYDTFMPAAVVKIKSGLDSNGRICLWDYTVFWAGDRSSQVFYDIPHYRVLAKGSWSGGSNAHLFEVGPWRAPGSNTNVFARESHIDTMAARVRIDPLEFRLNHLSNERMKKVLARLAEDFGWQTAPTPSGRGFGLSCADYLGTYVAAMVEIDLDESTGIIRVKRVVCVQDMGEVINPEGAKEQIEGCLMMGLGYALSEEIHFKGGEILDLNFNRYDLPRFSWLPEITVTVLENNSIPAQGGGEPAIINV
ncbi:MAG: molybdopterin-dependent oxidoreductase, partial [Candidatus Aminicenantes bacterium]|nr:molybdopterin-dependent oxidoreductase [Candidatus Aminicenantes bacterium]